MVNLFRWGMAVWEVTRWWTYNLLISQGSPLIRLLNVCTIIYFTREKKMHSKKKNKCDNPMISWFSLLPYIFLCSVLGVFVVVVVVLCALNCIDEAKLCVNRCERASIRIRWKIMEDKVWLRLFLSRGAFLREIAPERKTFVRCHNVEEITKRLIYLFNNKKKSSYLLKSPAFHCKHIKRNRIRSPP